MMWHYSSREELEGGRAFEWRPYKRVTPLCILACSVVAVEQGTHFPQRFLSLSLAFAEATHSLSLAHRV